MNTDTAVEAPPAPSFGQALAYWLKLGFISFGARPGRSP
jgi:hypothetical protein